MAFIPSLLSLKINCYSFTQMHRAGASISSGLLAQCRTIYERRGAGDSLRWGLQSPQSLSLGETEVSACLISAG